MLGMTTRTRSYIDHADERGDEGGDAAVGSTPLQRITFLYVATRHLVLPPLTSCMSCRYKLVGGPCPASYGLNVARLAGIPSSVLKVGNASVWMWLESMQPSHVLCGSQRATEKRDEAAATSRHEHAQAEKTMVLSSLSGTLQQQPKVGEHVGWAVDIALA